MPTHIFGVNLVSRGNFIGVWLVAAPEEYC